MTLKTYQAKRHFQRTPEPKGTMSKTNKSIFVVQKHAASHLHYDFRLAMNGVLKSWAVPKGPCLDSSVKRLAIEVEDHPLSYAKFEGEIPSGEYGAGKVIVWDYGTWEAKEDLNQAYKKGSMLFTLHGHKISGAWKLIKLPRPASKPQWLLIKVKDEYYQPLDQYDVTVKQPHSVLSNKTLNVDQISTGKIKKALTSKKPPIKIIAKDHKTVLTHPDKLLYPKSNITKKDLDNYYEKVAKSILPYIINRPISLLRCPTGAQTKCFLQKHWTAGLPNGVLGIPISGKKKPNEYLSLRNKQGLAGLAQLATLEIHPWASRNDNLDQPDQLIFDLDPDVETNWNTLLKGAQTFHETLDKLKLKNFIKLTGGKGLHVVIPLNGKQSYEVSKKFAKLMAEKLCKTYPELFTINMAKKGRSKKIFIDYLRNAKEATAIAPFSPRNNDKASIAVPVSWEKLARHKNSKAYNIKTIDDYFKDYPRNPWTRFYTLKQTITKTHFKALENL